jgi:multidrug efflux system membrane fusion protein
MRALFDNKDGALFPNQFINVQLHVDDITGAVMAPVAAVQHGTQGDFVYLVKPDDTVAVTPVKLGPGEAQNVSITDGLKPGDVVVVDGADRLKDGAQIVLPGHKPPEGADGAGGGGAGGAAGHKRHARGDAGPAKDDASGAP